MLIEIGLAVACIVFVGIVTHERTKHKTNPSANVTHPFHDKRYHSKSFVKARNHYLNKQYKDALREIDKALHLEPEALNYLWLRAEIYSSLGQHEETVIDCNEILYLDKSYPWAYAIRGRAYLELKYYDEALADLEYALTIEPDSLEVHSNLVIVHIEIKNHDIADTMITKLLVQHPENFQLQYNRVIVNYQLGRHNKVIEYGKEVVLDPKFRTLDKKVRFYLYHLIGLSHESLKEYEDALQIATVMESLLPNEHKFIQLRARIFRKQAKFRDAEYTYRKALENLPNNIALLYEFSGLLHDLKKFNEGVALSTKLITLSENSDHYLRRALHYFSLYQFENCLVDLTKAIELNPNEILAYSNRSIIYNRLKKHDEAQLDDMKVMELDEQEGLISRAITLTYLEQYDDAIHEYNRLLELAPDDAKIYNQRSWFRSYIGDYQGALLDGEQAILLDDTQATFFSTRGQAKWLMQNYDEALKDYTKAKGLNPDKEIHQFEVAIALLKLNKQAEAISLWQKVISDEGELQSAEAYQEIYHFAPPFYEAMQALEKLAQQAD